MEKYRWKQTMIKVVNLYTQTFMTFSNARLYFAYFIAMTGNANCHCWSLEGLLLFGSCNPYFYIDISSEYYKTRKLWNGPSFPRPRSLKVKSVPSFINPLVFYPVPKGNKIWKKMWPCFFDMNTFENWLHHSLYFPQ